MMCILIIAWAYLLSWVTSAVVHVVDADVGSLQGLREASVLVSVSIVAFILVVPVLLCRLAYRRGGWWRFLRALVAFAGALGFLVVILGFGGRSVADWLVALVGMSALIGGMLAMAVLPMVWLERRRAT